MTLRLGIGGFQHESHSFAPYPARFADFRHPGGGPELQPGPGLLTALAGTVLPCGGAIAAMAEAGAQAVPLAWAAAEPSGPMTAEAFERLAALLCGALATALDEGGLDGLYLDLHGAAMTADFADAEGEMLRRVRALTGPDLPIAASLDPHANLTRRMVDLADMLIPYRTYPHVDMRETGARAVRLLLARIARARPWARAFRQLDFLIPITSQCTLAGPMEAVMAERALLAARPGVVELGLCFGFPYADFADCGPAIAAFAETEDAALAATEHLAGLIASRESAFRADLPHAAEAVAMAIGLVREGARPAEGPVVIADTQDNPGGGGHGDTTLLLAELLRQGAQGALVCAINDADSAAACHRAGAGATVRLALGGRSDGASLDLAATVLRLTDGHFTMTGRMGAGVQAALGPCALIAAAGVRVIVTSQKIQALDQAIIRHFGIDPASCAILVLKSSVHFRAEFAPIAARIIVAVAPGPVVADPGSLAFRHLRPGLRLRPAAGGTPVQPLSAAARG